ncbi:MAG: carboxypeptidase M32 [Blautia sp.]|nr:carboxypeptidase M32 [Blautia sp.]
MSETFEKYQQQMKLMGYYERAVTLLSWDMYTQVPRRGYEDMGEALSYFSTQEFSLSTSDSFFELVEKLSSSPEYENLSPNWQKIISQQKKDLEEERRIPKEFFTAFVEAKNASMMAWQEAKAASDFSMFAPHLEKMVEMTKESCAYTRPGEDVYDVLLDTYEEGMGAEEIGAVFGELKEGLLPILEELRKRPYVPTGILEKTYAPEDQKKVQDLLLRYIGFSFEAGATGESEHPFTTSFSHRDVRVTSHFFPHDPLFAMFSTIHEGGHAIFDQNVDPSLLGTPMESCRYMGIHESQSRFYENILGRNQAFWEPIYTAVQGILPELSSFSLEEFMREVNHVQGSLIRTAADEVTYPLHIILRYELEDGIFRRGIPVRDLPELWNDGMERYLGVRPEKDSEGILQDMHWSDGSFGYFPSYLLGSIYDGMFKEKLEEELGSIDTLLREGKIHEITKWLNQKIHFYGGLRKPKEVIAEVCGAPLSAKPLLTYFRNKYLL